MNPSFSQAARHTLDGTIWGMLSEGLALPTGFLIIVFLTRKLGPAGYGLYTLAVVPIIWIESSIGALFTRATIKLVSEAEDWKPIGASLALMHLVTGCGAACLLWLTAKPIATFMGEPAMAEYLRLFAFDIPLFALILAHKYILVGLGGFRQRALTSAGRLLARLILIVLLVELGLSVSGAILGNIGASLVELAICRYYIRPAFLMRLNFPMRRFREYAVPLFLFSVSIQICDKADIFALMAMGNTAAVAGIYGVAQNLSTVPPAILAISFSPLLLSTLNRLVSSGNERSAKVMGCQAMRAIIALLPFAAMLSGAAGEITDLIFGPDYASAAPLLAILIFGALALVFVSISSAILTAGGKPWWAFALAGPLVPLAAIGYLTMIPRLGAIGASLATTFCAMLGAVASAFVVYRMWRILPPARTALRSLLISVIVYGIAAHWPCPGILVLLKLSVIAITVLLSYVLLGELSAAETALLRGLVFPKATAEQNKEDNL